MVHMVLICLRLGLWCKGEEDLVCSGSKAKTVQRTNQLTPVKSYFFTFLPLRLDERAYSHFRFFVLKMRENRLSKTIVCKKKKKIQAIILYNEAIKYRVPPNYP